MALVPALPMLGLALCLVGGTAALVIASRRSARDVVSDLLDHDPASEGSAAPARGDDTHAAALELGLISRAELRRARLIERACPFVGAAVGVVARSFLGEPSGLGMFVAAGMGFAGGTLVAGARARRRAERLNDALDFYLPIMMENVVMAVEAGLDVVSALNRVVAVTTAEKPVAEHDPVSRLLARVLERTEGGWGFEEALKDVAAKVGHHSVRHAFIHLGLAYREGGELVAPLRELSHSTQLYFQESIEERIAKLPVKATAPLLCTFTGLIICFITVPLIQVMTLTEKATPQSVPSNVSGERGITTILFAFMVLPILYFLFTLGLDLRVYSTESAYHQQVLDEATLGATRHLPRVEAARASVATYLAERGIAGATITATTSEVAVTLSAAVELSFPRLLGVNAGVPYGVYSRARVNPVDAFVAVDLGAYLAPDVVNGEVWGESGTWGAASYFESFPRQPEPPLDPRRLTAQCFNPALSAVKRSAVRAFDYLAAFQTNRVGLGIYPGNGYHLEVLRPLTPQPHPGGDFARYVNRYVRSEDCWRAAVAETWLEGYRFPGSGLSGGSPPDQATLLTPAGGFDAAAAGSVRAVDAVWGSVVRSPHLTSAGTADFGEVLAGLYSQIFGAPLDQSRGGLALNPRRVGIIFAGDVPREGGERFPAPSVVTALDEWLGRFGATALERRAHVRIYLVTFRHPGVAGLPTVSADLRTYAASRVVESEAGSFRFDSFEVEDGEEALEALVNYVVLDRQGGYLAR